MKVMHNKHYGFSALMALFYVVLFSIFGTFMLTFTTTSSLNTSQSLGSMQAWFATKSGLEWAVYQVTNRPACTCGTNCCTSAPSISGASLSFTNGGLNNFQSNITSCAETPVTEASTNYCVYDLSISGSRGSAGDTTYVYRNINISITDAP